MSKDKFIFEMEMDEFNSLLPGITCNVTKDEIELVKDKLKDRYGKIDAGNVMKNLCKDLFMNSIGKVFVIFVSADGKYRDEGKGKTVYVISREDDNIHSVVLSFLEAGKPENYKFTKDSIRNKEFMDEVINKRKPFSIITILSEDAYTQSGHVNGFFNFVKEKAKKSEQHNKFIENVADVIYKITFDFVASDKSNGFMCIDASLEIHADGDAKEKSMLDEYSLGNNTIN